MTPDQRSRLIVEVDAEIRREWPELREYKERGFMWPDARLTDAIARAVDRVDHRAAKDHRALLNALDAAEAEIARLRRRLPEGRSTPLLRDARRLVGVTIKLPPDSEAHARILRVNHAGPGRRAGAYRHRGGVQVDGREADDMGAHGQGALTHGQRTAIDREWVSLPADNYDRIISRNRRMRRLLLACRDHFLTPPPEEQRLGRQAALIERIQELTAE